MSNTTQPPADVRGRIIRASILPIEDEETMIARLRAGAEAVERGELDAEDFAGIWSQYLRELFRRASSVPAPADVRERVLTMLTAMEWTALVEHHDGRWYACCPWCGGENPDDDETPPGRAGHAERCELAAVLALLRAPRGEGEAMDADEMWNHWTSGHEDAALQGLRTASDDEAHRFLDMLARWQRCPMPSDHDAIAARRGEGGEALAVEVIRLNTALALLKTEENAAHVEAVATNAAWLEELERIAAFATRTPALRLDAALRSEAEGQGGIHPDPETWRCRQCGGYAAHYRDCPALRSEAQGEDGRDSVWVASAGVVYESGDAVDAFATEDEAVAWLKAQIDKWLRERLQWVEDEEEIEKIRSNAPEIEFGDGAHVVEAISGEWWKVQRYDLRAARRGEGGGE